MVYPVLLPLMRTPRLLVVDWTDAPGDLNGLVRFAETRNMSSARVPSHFNWLLPLPLLPNFFLPECNSHGRAGASSLRRFSLTLTHTTLGKTPLDEWSARRRDLYLTPQNTHKRYPCPPAGFEPAMPACNRPQTHAMDRAATGDRCLTVYHI